MAGRLRAGKANADIAWYSGNGVNTISSSSDYRVPLWDSLRGSPQTVENSVVVIMVGTGCP
jgi:hypothetical protein